MNLGTHVGSTQPTTEGVPRTHSLDVNQPRREADRFLAQGNNSWSQTSIPTYLNGVALSYGQGKISVIASKRNLVTSV
jgi:hypothetical protein